MEHESSVSAPAQKVSESRGFARDLMWVAVANLLNSLILGIVTLPALTKSYGSNIYGIWSQTTVTVTLLSPCIALQLGQAVVRFLAGEDDLAKRRQVMGAMLFAIVTVSVVVILVANIWAEELSLLLFGKADFTLYVRYISIWVCVNALFNFFISYLRARNKMKLLSIRQVAVALITMGLVIGLAGKGFEIKWVILSAILVQAAFTIMFWIWVAMEIGIPYPNLTGLKTFLAFSVPQIPGGILLWIVQFSDRYFITNFLGLSETGIYSSSGTLANLTSLFYGPISFVLYPIIARHWENKNYPEVKKYIQYSTNLFLMLAIPASVGIALLSQPLLKLLTTEEFMAGIEVVLFLSIGTVFLGIYNININIILLRKGTRLLPLMIAASAATNIIMNILLIPHLGIVGAAISNVSAYFVLATIVILWSRKIISYKFNIKFCLKVIISTGLMALSLWFLDAKGIIGLLIAVVTGTAVFVAGLLLLRAFSASDIKMIKETLIEFVPGNLKKKY
jgi:O-antigen/teichoic acid export membrane protein